jgi:hypothetical protein
MMRAIPEAGQSVRVRNRPAAVRDVRTFRRADGPPTHLVHVECIDGWGFPPEDQVVWEHEWQAEVLTGAGLPRVDDPHRRPTHRSASPRSSTRCDGRHSPVYPA